MLALEEGMRLGKIPHVKIYLDGMIREATAIHTTYPEYLNNDLRNLIFREGMNPFLADCFQQVDSSDLREKVINGDPCVIITTSGMLNGGPVMDTFLIWQRTRKTHSSLSGTRLMALRDGVSRKDGARCPWAVKVRSP